MSSSIYPCTDRISPAQSVIMPRVDGLQIAGDHCILDLDVSSGYQECGLVEFHRDRISHMRDTAGGQEIVICQSLTDLHS